MASSAPQSVNEPSPSSSVKLDNQKHAAYKLPSRPTHLQAPSGANQPQRRQWPQPSSAAQNGNSFNSVAPSSRHDYDDEDEDEEGAIDDSATSKPAANLLSSFRPAPPKTPPYPSNSQPAHEKHRGNDRFQPSDARKDQNHSSSYQLRSPSPPRRSQQSTTTSRAHVAHLRSPSPPESSSRRPGRDHDNGMTRISTNDRYHRGDPHLYHPSASELRSKDDRHDAAGSHMWDRAKQDLKRASNDDWRREDRGWNHDRRAGAGARGGGGGGGGGGGARSWDREYDRRYDRNERDRDRPRTHSRYHDPRDELPREKPSNRNGRDKELSPHTAGTEQQYAGWSPTPPQGQPADPLSNGNNGEPFANRPPSRMGRAAPPPLLSNIDHPPTFNANRDLDSSLAKRARSRSPPAGLLKRKANFNAVMPPALAPVNPDASAPAESENVTPGAPLPPKVETLQSPSMPASRLGSESVAATAALGSLPGSAIATAASSGAATATFPTAASGGSVAVPADANFNATCQALDDFTLPSVRLSCLPRKLPDRPSTSGRERRKARGPPVPLNQRKFVGCSSLDDYEISIKLGQGTFGEVLKGRQILTGTQVALKKVTIHDAKDGLPITALREIKLLKKLRHPSVVPVIDMAFRPSGERGKLGDVYMVEPYMDHDLNGMLENPSIRLEHSQIKLYMKQLLEGTLYLHKNRILHRDMKAANLLIDNQGQLQIADFGLARPYRDPGQSWTGKGWTAGTHRYTNMVVTRWYRPPELLAGEKKYGPPIDMWGIGCILAEMITGRPLFKGTSEINQLELIAKLCGSPNETNFPGWSSLPGVKDADPTGRPDPHPEIPGQHAFGDYPRKVKDHFRSVYDAGPGCADLIDKLLVLDPRKRLTAQQALEHEWFWTKPYPADPKSLPKYEHSKEIDRARRDWKPAPAAAAAAPGGGGMAAATMARPRPAMQQLPYIAGAPQQRAYNRPAGFAQSAGYAMPATGMPTPDATDTWDARAAPPPMAGGGARHAFPHPQGGARFTHPNTRPAHHAHPQQPQQPQQPHAYYPNHREPAQQRQQHSLPQRPVGPPRASGGNPYSM